LDTAQFLEVIESKRDLVATEVCKERVPPVVLAHGANIDTHSAGG